MKTKSFQKLTDLSSLPGESWRGIHRVSRRGTNLSRPLICNKDNFLERSIAKQAEREFSGGSFKEASKRPMASVQTLARVAQELRSV